MRRKLWLTILIIFVLAVLAATFDYPKYFNQGIDVLNSRFLLHFPYFPEKPFKLGLDLQGGSHLLYEADLSKIEEENRAQKMEELRDVIERRINIYGVTEPLVQIQGEKRLIIELAGIKDIGLAIEMIGETPYLEFREMLSEEEREEAAKDIPEEQILEIISAVKKETGQEISREEVLEILTSTLFKPTELTGEYLKRAQISFDPNTNENQIQLQFNKEGVELFEKITERNIGKPLAIFLDQMSIIDTDGDGMITHNDLYAPIVQEKITGGRAVITGNTDINKARKITQRLNSGALPVKIGDPISQITVGPTLGAKSLEKSLRAGILGFLAIILFMILFYRLPGILASISLMIYVALVLALFKLIPVTLTLAGIAGFVLSIGMAIDANVLIFSRMREERQEQKSFSEIIKNGFNRAWPSIRDSNATTLIVALILFGFGTSFVKGFAFTLGLGILVSLFSAIFITKNFLRCFIDTKFEKIEWLWK